MKSFKPLLKNTFIILSLFILQACSPVKKVLKDDSKFNLVAEEVIRRGYCVTDTVVETKIDTLYQSDSSVVNTLSIYKEIDTIFTDGSTLSIDSAGNLSFGCPVKIQYKTITKVETVRDKSYENILKKDIAELDSINKDLKFHIKVRDFVIDETESDLRVAKLKYKGLIGMLVTLVASGAFFKFKDLLPF
jgi:hypothetical protein